MLVAAAPAIAHPFPATASTLPKLKGENGRKCRGFISGFKAPGSRDGDGHSQCRLRAALLAWLVSLDEGTSSHFTPDPLVTALGSQTRVLPPPAPVAGEAHTEFWVG